MLIHLILLLYPSMYRIDQQNIRIQFAILNKYSISIRILSKSNGFSCDWTHKVTENALNYVKPINQWIWMKMCWKFGKKGDRMCEKEARKCNMTITCIFFYWKKDHFNALHLKVHHIVTNGQKSIDKKRVGTSVNGTSFDFANNNRSHWQASINQLNWFSWLLELIARVYWKSLHGNH